MGGSLTLHSKPPGGVGPFESRGSSRDGVKESDRDLTLGVGVVD